MSNTSINNKDWSAKLGERLRESEVQPSAALWFRIEQSATTTVIAPRKSFTQWWMATAAALLIAGIVVFELTEDRTEAMVEQIIAHEQSALEMPKISKEAPSVPTEIASNERYTPHTTTLQPTTRTTKEVAQELEKETPQKPRKVADKAPEKKERTQIKETPKRDYTSITQTPTKHKNRVIALNFSGGVNGTSSSIIDPAQPSALAADLLSANGYMEREHSTPYNTGELVHHAPLTFELSAAYSLADRLALVAGLNYTSLTTDITSAADVLATQRLQFMGLPIALQYDIVSSNRFSIYAGAGTTLERLISAKIAGVNIDEKNWHTSLAVALGAQYKLTKWLGIYAEPEVEHYLTETKLTTIRSQAPYNFNMKFGVRFSL